MQELLAYNINGIPVVFWSFMVALVLAMHYFAHASSKEQTVDFDADDKAVTLPQPERSAAIK